MRPIARQGCLWGPSALRVVRGVCACGRPRSGTGHRHRQLSARRRRRPNAGQPHGSRAAETVGWTRVLGRSSLGMRPPGPGRSFSAVIIAAPSVLLPGMRPMPPCCGRPLFVLRLDAHAIFPHAAHDRERQSARKPVAYPRACRGWRPSADREAGCLSAISCFGRPCAR